VFEVTRRINREHKLKKEAYLAQATRRETPDYIRRRQGQQFWVSLQRRPERCRIAKTDLFTDPFYAITM
jgi:hypothetical protein